MDDEAKHNQGYAQPEPKKGSWVVRVKATVIKEVYVGNCTRDQARFNPYDERFYDEEEEVSREDFKVLSIQSNDDQ